MAWRSSTPVWSSSHSQKRPRSVDNKDSVFAICPTWSCILYHLCLNLTALSAERWLRVIVNRHEKSVNHPHDYELDHLSGFSKPKISAEEQHRSPIMWQSSCVDDDGSMIVAVEQFCNFPSFCQGGCHTIVSNAITLLFHYVITL